MEASKCSLRPTKSKCDSSSAGLTDDDDDDEGDDDDDDPLPPLLLPLAPLVAWSSARRLLRGSLLCRGAHSMVLWLHTHPPSIMV